ncbi:hypothetical protein MYX64_08320 [Nitrospinae bacterium AH_259_B05_G02_I21]|nr:hypothetical protein [Nitrospinae bacterium AH_259_B05_G02_I21]MDA2932577.1 hypothetical protein [Nitrospinae bacterium AH-259-F20]
MPLVKGHNYHWMRIDWNSPEELDDFIENPDDYHYTFYAFLVWSRGRWVLAYIGRAYEQSIHWRIIQHINEGLVRRIKRHCKSDTVYISIGYPYMERGGNVTRQRVVDAAKLLIYVHDPIINKMGRKWIHINEHLRIQNEGSLRGIIKRRIAFGPVMG